MPESEAYRAAVTIGDRRRRRERLAVLFIALVVIAGQAVSIVLAQKQRDDLHAASVKQERQIGLLVAAKTAHNEALVVASQEGIRCVLTIPPNPTRGYRRTQRLINRCFHTFDELNRQHP